MTSWLVGNIPFVFCAQKKPGNSGFPEFMPFRLGFDEKDGTFIQVHDPSVEAVLGEAYASGSMLSGLMDEQGIGQRYAEDFLSFICEMCPSVRRAKILDVGCGTGYLLSRLKALGADVIGLEPGAHGVEGSIRHQVPIIRDYFPSLQVRGKFDVISAFGLLEHIVDPESILSKMKEQLAEGGWLILGVPDCEPYLAAGDISLFFHEHWSYFTRQSIAALASRVFGRHPIVKRAGFGGCLYVGIQKSMAPLGHSEEPAQQHEGQPEFAAFVAKAKGRIHRFWELLGKAWADGETVGIFVPWRAMNVLSLRPDQIPWGPMRFFDDNPLLHGTFYPGFPIPVESRPQLIARPPDRLLIMSNTFSAEIARQVRAGNVSIPIHTWGELFDGG